MAVALATLPLNKVLTGAGDACFAGAAATGLAAEWAAWLAALGAALALDLATGLAGAALPAAVFAPGFAAGRALALPLALLFLGLLRATTAAFFGAGFAAAVFPAGAFLPIAFLVATFFDTAFFATGFPGAAFLATGAFAGCNGLAADFLATGLLAAFFATVLATGLATLWPDFFATGFTAAFFGAALATVLDLAGLADVLLAFFTVGSFPATVVDLPALTPDEALLFCALAAVELRVVFAIFLHRLWPWRPGVIAHVPRTGKSSSGILVPLPEVNRSGTMNILSQFILWLLRLYKRWISPLLGPRCRFHPSCSDYARIAVTRFGPWRGSVLTGWRLLRCQPLCDGGEDPVPEHFHLPRCHCKEDSADHDP